MRNSDWSSDVCSSDLEARVVRARADITAIVTALNMYRLDNFDYPSTDQGLEALVKQPSGVPNWRSDGYLPAIPTDPWGREYLYLKPGAPGAFDVWSQGADGRSGGEGVAKIGRAHVCTPVNNPTHVRRRLLEKKKKVH